MKTDKLLHFLIVLLQYTLTCMVISGYVTGILCTIILDASILKFYTLGTSFVYYMIALVKSPGSLFDIHDSEVKGICTKCARIRSNQTKHCSICNKCYHRRDHHCIFLGKCIASNNMKEFVFSLLFLSFYGILRIISGPCRLLVSFLTSITLLTFAWFSCAYALEIISQQIVEKDKWKITKTGIVKYLNKMKESPVDFFFPFLKLTTTVDY